jgi:hypothetical protein
MADTRIEVNCATGEVTEVELTAEEVAQRKIDATAFAAAKAEEELAAQALANLKASAKAKLIAGQPLTAEEAATIIF